MNLCAFSDRTSLFRHLASSGIYMITRRLDIFFHTLHQERNRRNEIILIKLVLGNLVVVTLPLLEEIGSVKFLQKPL